MEATAATVPIGADTRVVTTAAEDVPNAAAIRVVTIGVEILDRVATAEATPQPNPRDAVKID